MKKIFTFIVAAVTALTINAKDFTENLTVTFNTLVTTQEQVIVVEEVENSDGCIISVFLILHLVKVKVQ